MLDRQYYIYIPESGNALMPSYSLDKRHYYEFYTDVSSSNPRWSKRTLKHWLKRSKINTYDMEFIHPVPAVMVLISLGRDNADEN